jgi:hypothetical protein
MAKPAETQQKKPESAPQPQQGGEQQHSKSSSSSPKPGKVREVVAGMCCAVGCKSSSKRFNFCDEHFDHFKFGLIKKTGERVSDYEKKIEHYMAHQSAVPMRKVA